MYFCPGGTSSETKCHLGNEVYKSTRRDLTVSKEASIGNGSALQRCSSSSGSCVGDTISICTKGKRKWKLHRYPSFAEDELFSVSD